MLVQIPKSKRESRRQSSVKPKILVLTSSLLTDRMFFYSGFLDELAEQGQVEIWATSYTNPQYRQMWDGKKGVRVAEFPPVSEFPRPLNYLRRLNEFIWDARLKLENRASMERHRRQRRGAVEKKILRPLAGLLARLKLEQFFENRLESRLISYERSRTAFEVLKAEKPDVVLVSGPFQFRQPAVMAAAKRLNIPVLCAIPSWDNLSTKNRLVFKYDGYFVWSEESRRQLLEYYPSARNTPVFVTGAPQFDVFFQSVFYQSREEFCLSQNLNPQLPLIVYALGSPNFLQEYHGAVHLAERLADGEFGNVQMLVRPHPLFDKGELMSAFERFAPFVRLQQTVSPEEQTSTRSQDARQITEWVNTFRYADVVVNLSSTVTVDAAIFDRPVINLDFDPQPEQPDQELIKEINHQWVHFKPVAESGGVRLVNNFAELTRAVNEYLQNPQTDRERRRWIVEYVCGYADGQCGRRMADAVMEFIGSRRL